MDCHYFCDLVGKTEMYPFWRCLLFNSFVVHVNQNFEFIDLLVTTLLTHHYHSRRMLPEPLSRCRFYSIFQTMFFIIISWKLKWIIKDFVWLIRQRETRTEYCNIFCIFISETVKFRKRYLYIIVWLILCAFQVLQICYFFQIKIYQTKFK